MSNFTVLEIRTQINLIHNLIDELVQNYTKFLINQLNQTKNRTYHSIRDRDSERRKWHTPSNDLGLQQTPHHNAMSMQST